jgi:hypothetical protein
VEQQVAMSRVEVRVQRDFLSMVIDEVGGGGVV